MKCFSFLAIAACALVMPFSLYSQEFRGTISGTVTDPSGGVLAGVKVTVTEENTGTKIDTVSDGSGQYTAPFLQPGAYDVSVQSPGFKEFLRKGIHVGSGDHPIIDAALQVGETTQTVEVTGDVPLINAENASVGQPISTKEVENLPLNGRTPLTLAALSIGVIATGQPSLIHPFDSGNAAGFSIGGSPSQTNEILINGSPDATWDGRLAYSPPQDAVQEVRVKAFDTDAAFGHTGGGTLNQIMKTGTNALHGSAWEFNQPNTLVANSFFNNKNGLPNPVTHYNQYGLTLGGPVIVPKVYDGRNKLFWFFAWEGLKDSQPSTTFLTVPTAAERGGDFSALLRVNRSYQLYNPFAAVGSGANNSTVTRPAYPNNIIPTSQLNPISLALLKFYPQPNVTPLRPDGFGNFGSTAPTIDDYSNELGRMDYNISQNNRLFFDVRHTDYMQVKNDYFGNSSTGSLLTRGNWGSSLDDVVTVNATNVVDLRFNFTRMSEAHPSPSQGFDPTTLGLPSYLASNSQYLQLPYIAFNSNSGFQSLGNNSANVIPSQSLQAFSTWVTIKGNHTIKTGVDWRQYVLNSTTYGNSVGSFSFSGNTWVRASNSASSTVVLGQDFASFLLGLPTGGQYDLNASGAYYQHYIAGFAQDDWRVKPNLTVNLGLRFDHDGPYVEKYGRTINGFDANAQSPIAAAAQAAYARGPIPQVPASAFNVRGGLTYPTDGSVYDTTSHLFSPRVGFAWSPEKLGGGKTVISGAFAMFVQPVTISSLTINGAYSTNPLLTQEGFSQTTTINPSNDNYLTPAATISDPFPGGISKPIGSVNGLGTFLGQTVQFIAPQQSNPYSLRWNVGIQRALGNNTVLQVVYMGNHGVHLPINTTQLNVIPRQYLSTLPMRDQSLITSLTNPATNPFRGLMPGGSLNTATTTSVAQLLAQFPQFPVGTGSGSTGVIENNLNAGSSYFQSLNVHLQRRFSGGLTVTANYIFSKLIEQVTWLNDTDPVPERRISPFDHPHRFVTAVSYELPVGKGRLFHFQSRWLDLPFGGWNLNTVYTYQTGAPLTWVNGSTTAPGDYIYFGGPLNLNNRQTNTAAFNTAAFDTAAADQLQYHIRTFSTTFPNLRADGINQFDLSALKNFNVTERIYFQLRGEAYNIINHPTFGAPNTTVTNSQFGLITAQANRTRTLQLGARFVF